MKTKKITDWAISKGFELSPQAAKLVDTGKMPLQNAMELAKVPVNLQAGLIKQAKMLNPQLFAAVVRDWFKARQEMIDRIVNLDWTDASYKEASLHELNIAEDTLNQIIATNPKNQKDLVARLTKIKAAYKYRIAVIDQIDFLFEEAILWVGNKAPEDMDTYEKQCKEARENAISYIRGGTIG